MSAHFLSLVDHLVQGQITVLVHPISEVIEPIHADLLFSVLKCSKQDRVLILLLGSNFAFFLAGIIGKHDIHLIKKILCLSDNIHNLIRDFTLISFQLNNFYRVVASAVTFRHRINIKVDIILIDESRDSHFYKLMFLLNGFHTEENFSQSTNLPGGLILVRQLNAVFVNFPELR